MEGARELYNTIGNELDPQNEQDRIECQEIGLQDNPEFLARDSSDFLEAEEAPTVTGLFKRINLKPDDEIYSSIRRMDGAQRLIVDITMAYVKKIIISRK